MEIKQERRAGSLGWGEVREGLTGQDRGWGGGSHVSILLPVVLSREVSKCKGPGAGACLECLKRARGQCDCNRASEGDTGTQVREATSGILRGAQHSAIEHGTVMASDTRSHQWALGRAVSGPT